MPFLPAVVAPAVAEKELTAQQLYERGFSAAGLDEKLRYYSEAICLKPDYAFAYIMRGLARKDLGDLEGALRDCSDGIRLKPDYAHGFVARGFVRRASGDLAGALEDYNEAIRLKPDYSAGFLARGLV